MLIANCTATDRMCMQQYDR